MIKFFRNIRKTLLREGKTANYLKYAIGEIVLVVIGILIAFQVNNWNVQRKDNIAERELYSRIIKDLQIDENRIQEHIEFFNKDQSVYYRIYQETQGISKYDSSVRYKRLRPIRLFNLVMEVNYSESLKDIKKVQIREKVGDYFKIEDLVKNAITDYSNFKIDHLRPVFSRNGINNTQVFFDNYKLNYFDISEKKIINYSKLKTLYGTVQFDQLLFNLGIKTSWALTALDELLKANKRLQLDLNNELNRD